MGKDDPDAGPHLLAAARINSASEEDHGALCSHDSLSFPLAAAAAGASADSRKSFHGGTF